ncbi:MAG: 5-formyltetrahydrofolate cyclo-ligase [Sphingomonadaceae bacterium]
MAVPPTPKAALRRELRDRRDRAVAAMSPAEQSDAAAALAQRLVPLVSPSGIVAAYIAIGSEIDPMPLIAALAATGCSIALPRVTAREAAMQFAPWSPGTPLSAGPFGLRQPAADVPEIVPGVILAPLLGFDAMRNRIGYGAGFYDRAFARFPAARRIGLAWAMQACEAIPTDPWDIPLEAIATEKAWHA